jgi:hypothetical protein
MTPTWLLPRKAKGPRGFYSHQNLLAARLILQDPKRHGGDDALMVRWARQHVVSGGKAQPRAAWRVAV